MFSNTKLRTKLLGGFVVVAAIALVIGALSILELRSSSEETEKLYQNMTVPLSELGDIATAFQRVRINVRDMVGAESDEDMEKCAGKIKELRAEIDKKAELYEKTILSAEMRKAFEAFTAARVAYEENLTRLIELAEAHKDS